MSLLSCKPHVGMNALRSADPIQLRVSLWERGRLVSTYADENYQQSTGSQQSLCELLLSSSRKQASLDGTQPAAQYIHWQKENDHHIFFLISVWKNCYRRSETDEIGRNLSSPSFNLCSHRERELWDL
jgi:hypothetical protein